VHRNAFAPVALTSSHGSTMTRTTGRPAPCEARPTVQWHLSTPSRAAPH
jgi:hypothetical protein